MTESFDTTDAFQSPPLPGPEVTTVHGPSEGGRPPVAVGPPAADATVGHFLSVRNGKVYAVELRDGWIPERAVGSIHGDDLNLPARDHDWSNPTDARDWNVATLVPLCDAERKMMVEGRVRAPSKIAGESRRALPSRRLTDRPSIPKL